LKRGSSKAMLQVLTGPSDRPAMACTTALESTPPDRKAPSGTSAIMRRRTLSLRRSVSSAQASASEIGLSSVKRTSQYSRGAGTGWPRRTVSVCAGGSFSAPLKMVRGSAT